VRQSALHALLEDCLKAAAKEEPTLIVLEDLHWLDALSHDLLEELAKALANYRVCFVLAYRPPQLQRLQAPRLETLPHFSKIEIHELTLAEAGQAIRAKLAQLYPTRGGTVPSMLVEKLMSRAQGNPFYLEELLNFLHDRGFDPRDPSALEKIELPDSLHTLILSRIDQLTEHEKTTLRVASIIGRLFRAHWLIGYYPELGALPQVKTNLDELSALDITPLDTPEPELAYLFKHIVTHEATYESLPFATRARLHEQLAHYLEAYYPDTPPLEILAFHYGRSENTEKQCEYYYKAGEAAQKAFANEAALAYYGQLLPLLPNITEKIKIIFKRGAVLGLTGAWGEAEAGYRAVLEMVRDQPDVAATAEAQYELGKLSCRRGDFDDALAWLAQAKMGRTVLDDRMKVGQIDTETGIVLWHKGEYAQAVEPLNEGLALARTAGDRTGAALALNNLGNVAYHQGDYSMARDLYEQGLALRRELGDKVGIAASLSNLGLLTLAQSDYSAARAEFEESLAMRRKMGDKVGIAASLNNLGLVAFAHGDYLAARTLLKESLALKREMGDKRGIAMVLNSLGSVALAQADNPVAKVLNEESLMLQREIGDKEGIATSLANLGSVALAQGDTVAARAEFEESLALCREMDDKSNIAYALLGLGLVSLEQSTTAEAMPAALADARQHLTTSLRLRQELEEMLPLTSSLISMAGYAMQTGNALRSAQLLGCADAALKALNATVEEDILHFHTQTLAAARAALGEDAFQAAWAEGEKLSLEEAVKLAEEA
jgi:adenylate cyclase